MIKIPKFLTDESTKPEGQVEWLVWGISQAGVLCSLLVAVPFMVLGAFIITVVSCFEVLLDAIMGEG